MIPDELESFFPFLLSDVSRLFRKTLEKRVQAINLTRAQAQVLGQVSMNEGIKQSALADRLEIQNITLTRLLDRLEENGLVERRSCSDDRRVKRLYLTAAAEPVLDEMWDIAASVQDLAFDGLSETTRQALVAGLAHARERLAEKAEDPGNTGRAQPSDMPPPDTEAA